MVVGIVLMSIAGFGMGIVSFIAPIQRELSYATNTQLPNALPEPLSLIDMRYRKLISEDNFMQSMEKYGFDELNSTNMFNSAQALISAPDLVQAKWRGEIDEAEYYKLMKRAHVTKESADTIESVLKYIPNPQDFIRFAVREVFRPDIVEKFGMDEFFPEDIVSEIAKIGMSADTMKWYWRAHWELPSMSAATEMFHRLNPKWETETPVDRETFLELLRVQDVMPYWIPRMEKVLFKLPTRVDIRRMLKDGHITEDETHQLYQMLGYDELNADRMTALAKGYYQDTEENPQRKLSLSLILKALDEGEIDSTEAIEFVEGLGYLPEHSELIVRLKEIELADKELETEIDTQVDLFAIGTLNEHDLILALDELNIPSTRKDKLIRTATITKRKKERLPPKEDIKAFLKKGHISTDRAKELLKELGVPDEFIGMYVLLWS